MRNTVLCFAVVVLGWSLALGQAQEKVLYSFAGSDGSQPFGELVFDAAGHLYGTTQLGGSQGWGTVFQLSLGQNGSWNETVLYNFCQDSEGGSCLDGAEPLAGLVTDSDGNLYGTTSSGGNCPNSIYGCGIVFQLSPPLAPGSDWQETVLYSFCQVGGTNCLDGAFPYAKLVFDSSGNLYSTAREGGEAGVVFELSSSPSGWTETVIYSFCALGKFPACPDGSEPQTAVTFDDAGNLYGTTSSGGRPHGDGGYGVLYRLSPGINGWTETVLDRFPGRGGADLLGSANLSKGYIFSTAWAGGDFNKGVVFRYSPANGGTQKTFSFSGTNGALPASGVLIDPRNGTLYGTTEGGGINNCSYGCGTVYKIDGKGQSVIHFFPGASGNDGAVPVAALISDKKGHLYGTTSWGGTYDEGTVFEITP